MMIVYKIFFVRILISVEDISIKLISAFKCAEIISFMSFQYSSSAFPQMLSDLEELPEVSLGDFKLRIEMDELTPFDEEVAAKELRETSENRENGLKDLRMLLKQGRLTGTFVVLAFVILKSRRQQKRR